MVGISRLELLTPTMSISVGAFILIALILH